MTIKLTLVALLASSAITGLSQENRSIGIDSNLAKKITVSGFCLCQTTLANLHAISADFKEVEVEEMDLGKRCISQDARFINGKGYASNSYPGLVFQKDPNSDYVSKIRLTKGFKGKLPDGTPVDLKTLLLKDVIKIYPAMESKWGSRGCSDYWSFSNDTLAYYVKIDTTKKPQFPIDEAYYLEKPVDGIDLFISCYSIRNKPDNFQLFAEAEPMIFLDSIRVNKGVLKEYSPNEIAQINIYKGENAIKIAGKEAKNGAIYVMTKSFARESYWNFFCTKSADYKRLIPNVESEMEVVYILNGKVLKNNFESDLVKIDNASFQELIMLDKETLKKTYKLSGKNIGVSITTKQ